MTDAKDGFLPLTVDDRGRFMLGEERLFGLTLGEIGAVFDVRLPRTLTVTETVLLRVLRTGETDRSAAQETLASAPAGQKTGVTSMTLAGTYRGMGYGWQLRLNAELSRRHMESDEAVRAAEARIHRLTETRNRLVTELKAVNDEDGMLRAKFAGTISGGM